MVQHLGVEPPSSLPTTVATDLVAVEPKVVPHLGVKPPSSLPTKSVPTDLVATYSLTDEQTTAPFVVLPVKLADLTVSALVNSGATHNFLAASVFQQL